MPPEDPKTVATDTPEASPPPNKNERSSELDTSLVVALVAILISLVGTITSIYEARILRAQQESYREEKAAAVWPYIKAVVHMSYNAADSSVVMQHTVENKGVGPAILGDVRYIFRDNDVESYSIDDELRDVYPDLTIEWVQNLQIDETVLSAGDKVSVFTVRIYFPRDVFASRDRVNEIAEAYRSEFCYCSVYGECWKASGTDRPAATEACQVEL